MAAVPIYVWNGTAWQETGPTIPASPIKYQASAPSSPSTGDIWVDSDGDVTSGSTQLQRFRFVASGGETSLSGNDANGATLAYTAGMEQVVLNGAVLVRGYDYTATNGTTISGLSPALVANDVVEVFSFMAFNVANTYTQSQVDGLLNDYMGMRLIVPSSATNGTISTSGKVTFTTQSSVSLNGVFSSTYDDYLIKCNLTFSNSTNLRIRMRSSGTDVTGSNYTTQYLYANGATVGGANTTEDKGYLSVVDAAGRITVDCYIYNPNLAVNTFTNSKFTNSAMAVGMCGISHGVATAYDSVTIYPGAGTMTGNISIYGYKN